MKRYLGYFLACFLMLMHGSIWAQNQKEISGTVSDEDGMPVPQVNVIIEGTDAGTYTDFDGKYELEVEEGDVLRYSAIGFQDQTITVADENVIDIVLVSGD